MTPKEKYNLQVWQAFDLLTIMFQSVELETTSFMSFKILLKSKDGSVQVFTGKSAANAIERAARTHTVIFDK